MMNRKRLEKLRDKNKWVDPFSNEQTMSVIVTALALLDEIEILAQENMILQEAARNDRPSVVK